MWYQRLYQHAMPRYIYEISGARFRVWPDARDMGAMSYATGVCYNRGALDATHPSGNRIAKWATVRSAGPGIGKPPVVLSCVDSKGGVRIQLA